jgi:hypothetical protein
MIAVYRRLEHKSPRILGRDINKNAETPPMAITEGVSANIHERMATLLIQSLTGCSGYECRNDRGKRCWGTTSWGIVCTYQLAITTFVYSRQNE